MTTVQQTERESERRAVETCAPVRRAAATCAALYAGYVAAAATSALVFGSSQASAFFLPAGVTVATLLLTRRRLWPLLLATIVVAELSVDLIVVGLPGQTMAGFALAVAIEPLIGASLVLAWCGGTPDLRQTGDLFRYLLGAGVIGPLSSGVIGAPFAAGLAGSSLVVAGLQWFAGDAVSVLVIGIPILLWRSQSRILRARPLESAAVLVAATIMSVAGFGTQIPPAITVLPVLAWAALRLGMLGTALAGAVVAFVGNALTGANRGQIAGMSLPDPARVAVSQIFVAVLVTVALVIAQEVAKRTEAIAERDVERGERLHVESLSQLARKLSEALTPADIGRTLETHLLEAVGAASFGLGVLGPDGARLDWVGAAGQPPPESAALAAGLRLDEDGVAAEVARTGRAVVIGAADPDGPGTGRAADWMHLGAAGVGVALPLAAGDATIGVLLLGWDDQQPFDVEQWGYISAAAAMIGQSLLRAQSYADEHARAAVLHSALHPAGPVGVVGLQYSVCYEPADLIHGLGGDWYDVMPLPKNRTYLAVGDIVGHGLTAVEDMAQLRTAGRAFAYQGRSPDQLLADLNAFAGDISRGEFATMVVAVFDHHSGLLSYCAAGHPPALLRRADTGEVIRLDGATGPVLGPMADAAYVEEVLQVAPGDTLVLYTDGLVEHISPVIWDGVSKAEQVVADWPAGAVLDGAALAGELAPNPPRPDDVCIVVVRFGDEAPGDDT